MGTAWLGIAAFHGIFVWLIADLTESKKAAITAAFVAALFGIFVGSSQYIIADLLAVAIGLAFALNRLEKYPASKRMVSHKDTNRDAAVSDEKVSIQEQSKRHAHQERNGLPLAYWEPRYIYKDGPRAKTRFEPEGIPYSYRPGARSQRWLCTIYFPDRYFLHRQSDEFAEIDYNTKDADELDASDCECTILAFKLKTGEASIRLQDRRQLHSVQFKIPNFETYKSHLRAYKNMYVTLLKPVKCDLDAHLCADAYVTLFSQDEGMLFTCYYVGPWGEHK